MNLNIDWKRVFSFDNSCVIVIPVDPMTANAIYMNGGEEEEELHITLLYFPEVDDINQLHNACKKVAGMFSPFVTYSESVGSFDTGDNKTIHLNMTKENISDVRSALMEEVDGYSTKFPDYKPHLTLAYVPKDTPMPEHEVTTLNVDAIEVWTSNNIRFRYPLRG